MALKGAYRNYSFWPQFLLLLSFVVIGLVFFSLLSGLYLLFRSGMSLESSQDIVNNLLQYPHDLRVTQFLQCLFVFFLPSIVVAYLFGEDVKTYLSTVKEIPLNILGLTIISAIVVIPVLNFLADWNARLVLPDFLKGLEDWMKASEKEAADVTQATLNMKNAGDLLVNILIIGVMTGLGEEFLFRGVMQQVFRKAFRNEHTVIWIVAFIFSAVHFQFYGFIPRLLLGAYFGYLLYYTKCIWIPVVAHFANNAFAVAGYYSLQSTNRIKELDTLGTASTWWVAVIALGLWSVLFWAIRKESLRSS